MGMDGNRAWWTPDEIRFVQRIAERKDQTAFDGYCRSLSQRKNWAGINREAVEQEVERVRVTRL